MMRSNESASSVFYHSQEEEPGRSGSDGQGPPKDTPGTMFDPYQSNMSESSPVTAEQETIGKDPQSVPELMLDRLTGLL